MQRQDGSSDASGRNGARDGQLMQVEDEESEEYAAGQQIVLHEDKQYYPDPEKIFGADVENLVMEEDAQPLT